MLTFFEDLNALPCRCCGGTAHGRMDLGPVCHGRGERRHVVVIRCDTSLTLRCATCQGYVIELAIGEIVRGEIDAATHYVAYYETSTRILTLKSGPGWRMSKVRIKIASNQSTAN